MDICESASAALDVDVKMEDATLKEAGAATYNGWGTKNVVTVRSAWVRVHLLEGEAKRVESEQRARSLMGSTVSSPNNNLSGGDVIMAERVLSSPSVASSSRGMEAGPRSSSSKPQEAPSTPAATAVRKTTPPTMCGSTKHAPSKTPRSPPERGHQIIPQIIHRKGHWQGTSTAESGWRTFVAHVAHSFRRNQWQCGCQKTSAGVDSTGV